MSDIMPVMEKLRVETRAQHAAVEALPFLTALLAVELPLVSYVGFLRAMAVVHEALESAVGEVSEGPVREVWNDDMRREVLIRRDLQFFEDRNLPHLPAPALAALVLAGQIRLAAAANPVSLLGYLYVLHGSTLGGQVLRAPAARAFELQDGRGLAYLSGHEKATRAQWKLFAERMNNALEEPALQEPVVEAAREAFEGVEHLIRQLHPIREQRLPDLTGILNREAGTHPITTNVREVEAALRAGERTWLAFPYYELRFGARGKRFTRSDSAWVVTLTDHPQGVVDRHVRWLGVLLAARGMPQLLLELHLEVLHTELIHAVPEKREVYGKLLSAAHMLGEMRRTHVNDKVMQRLASAFDAQVGAEWSERLRGSGRLLVAAVADEKSGITNAVTSLESWMVEPTRFPDTWIRAVRTTIRKARDRAR